MMKKCTGTAVVTDTVSTDLSLINGRAGSTSKLTIWVRLVAALVEVPVTRLPYTLVLAEYVPPEVSQSTTEKVSVPSVCAPSLNTAINREPGA